MEYMANYLGIPEDAVPPPLRRFVSQVTMGNPLYIRETLDQLLQDGNLKVGGLHGPRQALNDPGKVLEGLDRPGFGAINVVLFHGGCYMENGGSSIVEVTLGAA